MHCTSYEGGAYAALILIVVFYSLVLEPRSARVLSVFAALVYLAQHGPLLVEKQPISLVFVAMKTALIVVIAEIVSRMSTQRDEREKQAIVAQGEKEQLNQQLQQRLSELQAVSQVTEIIHSSLDFDRVGPLVLEVLTKVINVPACCLFVIDKHKAETLFSASVGISDVPMTAPPAVGFGENFQVDNDHFSCTSIVDHRQMMVVFCAETQCYRGHVC